MNPEHPPEYQFIMSENNSPKNGFRPNSSSMKGRILVAGSALLGLVVLVFLVIALFSFFTTKKTGDVKDISARQTEILRVVELGLDGTTNKDTKNKLSTIKTVVSSDKISLSSYMKKNKIQLDAVEQNAKKDKDSDKNLETAKQNNRFDDELNTILDKLISGYTRSLKTAFEENETKSGKSVLSVAYKNVGLIGGPVASE
jgi:hypothetical protein